MERFIQYFIYEIFGESNFQSEIIWTYKRWSNAKKGLLPSHQNIYFYTKTKEFKFNTIFQEYSESTNVDQILQKRTRDKFNKSIYARNENGEIIEEDEKDLENTVSLLDKIEAAKPQMENLILQIIQ